MACDAQGGIAKNGTLPWPKNSKDLAWFKQKTQGCTVIMGSKTWNDPFMPSPLPQRRNVVVTSNPDANPGADEYITSNLIQEILRIEQEHSRKDRPVWIIGGANLVEQTEDIFDAIYLTIMENSYKCDTFIPLKQILRHYPEVASQSQEGMTMKILEKFNTGK